MTFFNTSVTLNILMELGSLTLKYYSRIRSDSFRLFHCVVTIYCSLVVCLLIMWPPHKYKQWSATTSFSRSIPFCTNFLQTGQCNSWNYCLCSYSSCMLCNYFLYLLVKTSSQKVWRRSSFGSYGLIKMQGGRPATTSIIPLAPANVSIRFQMYFR